jgi:RNA binding exosome subunit
VVSALQSIEVSYFLQMTEDEGKVKRAVASLLGGDAPEEREEAEGHFGNNIVWIRHHITGDDAANALRNVVSHIDMVERRAILEDIGAATDEHNALYLRLSKQVLVASGRAVLASSDPIRVKVKPRSRMVGDDTAGFYARLLEVREG